MSITLLISAPDKKNGKTADLGGAFWEGFGEYVRVLLGGFWMVWGGVFRGF